MMQDCESRKMDVRGDPELTTALKIFSLQTLQPQKFLSKIFHLYANDQRSTFISTKYKRFFKVSIIFNVWLSWKDVIVFQMFNISYGFFNFLPNYFDKTL